MAKKKKQKQKQVPQWKKLANKGWKVYNNGINNKMFPNATSAHNAGFFYEGFLTNETPYTTHFTYRELYGTLH